MKRDLKMLLIQIENMAKDCDEKGYHNLAHRLRRAMEPIDCETEVA